MRGARRRDDLRFLVPVGLARGASDLRTLTTSSSEGWISWPQVRETWREQCPAMPSHSTPAWASFEGSDQPVTVFKRGAWVAWVALKRWDLGLKGSGVLWSAFGVM